MKFALAGHDEILRRKIESHGGYVFKTVGDAFCAAFAIPSDALGAALTAQRSLQAPLADLHIRVRMALHTGVTQERDNDYFGPPLNRVARLLSAGHGGQTLISAATEELLRDDLPGDAHLLDMGERLLKDLHRPIHIFQLVVPDLPADFPPLKTLDSLRTNLPAQLTSFIGREKEIEEVKHAVTENRLVTLVGPGGTGKTRLALQATADLLDLFPEGVWFIELAPLGDPALVPQALASLLGLREEGSRPIIATLTGFLQAKKVLFILDNCEHLIEASAQLASTLLHSCPQVSLITSSRETLGITGEIAYRVPPLSLPDVKHPHLEALVQYEAVQLFVERARSASPSFQVTAENAPAIAQICSRLDGIPLALELAAARVRLLNVEQISVRLDDRFRLLTGGSRTALPRQQTLRALIDWSWDLLTAQERTFLERLAVFSGGWTLDAAEQICAGDGIEAGDILDLLGQLVNKSLVNVGQEQGPEARYNLLETIRQYAREKLLETGNGPASRARHLHYFSGLAGQAEIELHRHDQKRWLERLDGEHDNFRLALEWAIDTQPEESILLCAGLAEFWDIRGYINEGLKWVTRALEAAQGSPPSPIGVDALFCAAMLASRLTDVEQFKTFTEKGLEIARQIEYRRGIARALQGMGLISEYFQGKPEQADAFYADSLRLWREEGDKLGIGQALGPQAARILGRQDYAGAERLFKESLALFRELGDQREIAGALGNLAEVSLAQTDDSRAEALAGESLALYRELEDKHGIATALRTLGQAASPRAGASRLEAIYEESYRLFREMNDRGCLAVTLATGGRVILAEGDTPHAQRMIWEGLALSREIGENQAITSALEGAAEVLLQMAHWPDSACLFGAAESYRESVKVVLSKREQSAHEQSVMALRAQLDEGSLAQAWAKGKGMTMEKALEYALGLPFV
jgi:predicted ATPase